MMNDDPVTLGELSRRLNSIEHRFEGEFAKLGRSIDSLQFVHHDQYRPERDAINRRIDDVEGDVDEIQEDRKWMVRAIIVSILFPLIVAFGTALALGGRM